ncbi:PspC domain-containing protein [Pueribacillus sp. YX66]
MKLLTKSSHDKALFGVCGGIAEYLGISPFVVQFFFVFIIPASF